MKIHEYQGKDLFRKYGVPVPFGIPAMSVDEAMAAVPKVMEEAGTEVVVVKAQIHAGGRGMGGGVKVCKGKAAAEEAIKSIYGMQLVTHQTGPEGKEVQRLLVEQGLDIKHEYYLGITLDRATGRVTVMASTEGGMEIEEVAERSPEKILREAIHPGIGWQDHQSRRLGFALGLDAKQVRVFGDFMKKLTKCYEDMDCSLLEVNPLITTGDGRVLALDAKINFDDNGLYRHKELEEWRDLSEEDASEVEASKYDLSFINLDGTIGCMVNGAGLAMSTMDIIKHYGGEPANFLDVGGGAKKEQIVSALNIITKDPAVNCILVNIFGGIMRCDIIAEGVIAAVAETGLEVPLVVRLAGTNAELGKQILAESGLAIIPADTLADAAEKAVAAAQGK